MARATGSPVGTQGLKERAGEINRRVVGVVGLDKSAAVNQREEIWQRLREIGWRLRRYTDGGEHDDSDAAARSPPHGYAIASGHLVLLAAVLFGLIHQKRDAMEECGNGG